MIDLFLLWTDSAAICCYQQAVDNIVNNIIPLCITFINKSLHLWMDERLAPDIFDKFYVPDRHRKRQG